MIGALISAGASLVGGILGSNKEDKARRRAEARSDRQLQTLRADAIAAGFNPLTALHATGGGSYGGAFFAPTNHMGNAIQDAASAFLGGMERRTQARQEASADRAVAANDSLNRRVAVPMGAPRIFDGATQRSVAQDHAQGTEHDPRRGFAGNVMRAVDYIKDLHEWHTPGVPVVMADRSVQRISPAQADAMGIGFGDLMTNDAISSVWGFQAGEDVSSGRRWSMERSGMPRKYATDRLPDWRVPVENLRDISTTLYRGVAGSPSAVPDAPVPVPAVPQPPAAWWQREEVFNSPLFR